MTRNLPLLASPRSRQQQLRVVVGLRRQYGEVRPRSPIPWVCRKTSAQLSMAGVVAVGVAAATTPALPPRQAECEWVVAPRVVLGLAGIFDLLAVAGRREQVELQRRVVPPALPVPEAVLPKRAAVVRRTRPLPAGAQLPKA